MLFKKTPIYIKVFQDKIEITNLATSKTVVKSSPLSFSTSRVVMADFNIASSLIRDILDEIVDKKIFQPQLNILIQQIEPAEGGLVEIEKRALRDLAEQAGGTSVTLLIHHRKLSDDEALMELK